MNNQQLSEQIKTWAQELGFQQAGISDLDLSAADKNLQQWLAKGFAGSMSYMSKHGSKRTHPEQLIPGTIRVIMLRINYQPETTKPKILFKQSDTAYIARYALGRDYHKLIRKKLKILAEKISAQIPDHQYRVFTDSAPVMEKPLAAKAGLGWQGKNTLLLNEQDGSYFFLGTIYTNLPLAIDNAAEDQCGACRACINICPTKAIVAPYQLDAKRCISYLTIENKGAIPHEFRKAMGNRIFGCDDCQIICPWNRYATLPTDIGFQPRKELLNASLIDLFAWDEATFLEKTQGSVLRRPGYIGWLRNIAVALGNAPTSEAVIAALQLRSQYPSELVREHVQWALAQHIDTR